MAIPTRQVDTEDSRDTIETGSGRPARSGDGHSGQRVEPERDPGWLLLPQGVSGAIKRRSGLEPFRELGCHGPILLGGAVRTGAG